MTLVSLLTTLVGVAMPVYADDVRPGAESSGESQTAEQSPNTNSEQQKVNLGGKLSKLEPIYDSTKIKREFVRSSRLTGGLEQREINWDPWYTKVGLAVLDGVFTSIADYLNTPNGLRTMFQVEVTSDKRITKAEISRSSGNLWFDAMVLKAVRRLDGNDVWTFPEGSMRTEITAELGVTSGQKRNVAEWRFYDVEFNEGGRPPEAEEPIVDKSGRRSKHR